MWIIADGLPLSLSESEWFRDFAVGLRSSYQPLSRKQLGEKVKAMAKKIDNKVKEELEAAYSVNLSFDNWTSLANRNYIAITGHYITRDFQMVDRCLVLEHYDTGHSAIAIRDKVRSLLEKYGLAHCSATLVDSSADDDFERDMLRDDEEREDAEQQATQINIPLTFTTDNAPAMCAAMDGEPGWERMPCFAHVTALAVNVANKVPSIRKWKQHVTNIVGHFKHSAQHLD